jgi:hypothetical protein
MSRVDGAVLKGPAVAPLGEVEDKDKDKHIAAE